MMFGKLALILVALVALAGCGSTATEPVSKPTATATPKPGSTDWLA
jgi:uncharacterized protein YceK